MEPKVSEEKSRVGLTEVLQSLPLLSDDLYLRMQALNLGLVDGFIVQMEQQLLHEYMESESTPFPMVVIVSALSQLWTFGVYELLRTWRQRARDILRFADEVRSLHGEEREARMASRREEVQNASAEPDRVDPHHWRTYELVIRDEEFARQLRTALDRSERPFRMIEALRIHLAKHEMPRMKGSFGWHQAMGGST